MTAKKAHSLERVMDAAADLATHRGVENVSIAEIASVAHCSTATIYECFVSKENLLFEAFEHGQAKWSVPLVAATEDSDVFDALVAYFHDRIAYLGSERLLGLLRLAVAQRGVDPGRMRAVVAGQDQLPKLVELVARAMRDGHLRTGDAATTAYVMQASISYEPILCGLLFDGSVDPTRLLRTVFIPHVTEEGAASLEIILAQQGDTNGSAENCSAHLLLGAHAEPASSS